MALIQCSNCGKDVSDKAKICPNCGTQLIDENSTPEQETPAVIVCEECGTEYAEDAEVCPNCGNPTPVKTEPTDAEPQKAEVVSVNLPVKIPTKKIAIISVIAVIVFALIAIIASVAQKNAEKEAAASYASNLESATSLMLTGAAEAESAGNLIKSVWYNAIYEKRDSSTDKYTKPRGYWVDDFNEALGNLFADSTFKNKISKIETNQKSVESLMRKLKNPPAEYEDAYDAIKDLYNAYLELTNLATNPQGSLQTFSSNFNKADSDTLKYYKAMKTYID